MTTNDTNATRLADKPEAATKELQTLWDKEEIRSAMYRYARGVDRRDYDLVRSVYHSDAYDDHGSYKGNVDGLIDWLSRRHVFIEQSMHIICHTHIDFLADEIAVAENYVIVPQRYPSTAQETIRAWVGDKAVGIDERLKVIMYVRMIDRFEKRGGQWKIARRAVVVEDVDAKLIKVSNESPVSMEQIRGPGDAIYTFLRG